jgi:hypothetical protein
MLLHVKVTKHSCEKLIQSSELIAFYIYAAPSAHL